MELQFNQIYGSSVTDKIKAFLINNELLPHYIKIKDNPDELLRFGVHYGIIELVAFCYCHLKCPVDISEIVSGYNITIYSSLNIENKVALETESANSKMSAVTIDKYTENRQKCISYLIDMKKFSKCKFINKKAIYTINPIYVEDYKLLNV